MSRKHRYHIGIAYLLAFAAAVATTGIAFAVSWISPVDLSGSEPIQDKDRVAVAAVHGDVVAIWARSQAGTGVTIARRQGTSGTWTKSNPGTIIPGQLVWAPTVIHSGAEIVAAWAEGSVKGGCDTSHRIVAYSIAGSTTSRRTVKTIHHGPATTPHVAVNAAGWHMVFAGSDTAADCRASRHGLYYSFRAAGSQEWSVPTRVIAHNAAFPDAIQAGVSHPRIATVPGSTTIHIVWEQYEKQTAVVDGSSIWHASGVAPSSFAATRARLSPVTQQYAVRPSIAITANRVHVAWTQTIGSGATPTAQHIWYRTLQSATLTRLNEDLGPVHVNSNFPTFAGSSLFVQAEKVCATWHGYYGSAGAGREQVTARCSENSGISWQTPINVSGDTTRLSIFPAISIDPAGLLHFAWAEYELTNNAYQPVAIFYRNSSPARPESPTLFLPLVSRGK